MSFEHDFDPYEYDVIYGLTMNRNDYIERYVEHRMKDWDPNEDSEDEFRESLEGLSEKYMSLINSYNEPILDVDFLKKPPYTSVISKIQRGTSYITALQKTRYAIDKVHEASVEALNKGNVTIKDSLKTLSSPEMASAATVLAIRRACKFGIEYIAQVTRKGKVHYVLDGIDMSDVVGKKAMALWTGTTGVPITTSELRYLFRNWYRLKNDAAKGRIRFWMSYQPSIAPWDANPKEWLQYAKHRLEKRKAVLSKYGSLMASFDTSPQSDPASALKIFFEIPTGDTLIGG
jgi:hypothetical protein